MRTLVGRLPLLRRDNLLGQGLRFTITGVVVSIVYIGITTTLAATSKMPFQAALAIGWCAAIAVHFTLQRVFVWTHSEGFALPFRHQIGRYLLVACSQLGVTALATTVLPSLLGLSAEIVYLGTSVSIMLTNFLVFRHGVFHPEPTEREPALGRVRPLPELKVT